MALRVVNRPPGAASHKTAAHKTASHRAAFTFLEVLVSLLICTLMIGALTAAVIHITRLDRRTTTLRDSATHLQTIATRVYLDQDAPDEVAIGLPPGWEITIENILTEDEPPTPWQRWSIVSVNAEGAPRTVSLRAGLGGW